MSSKDSILGASDARFDPETDPGLIAGGFESLSRADNRQDMLSVELHHRVQNTLAIVLSLARITARSVKTIEEFQVAFGNRVQAMARTNALLLRGHIQALNVQTALEVELEPYVGSGKQVSLNCEDVKISATSALSLSLLFHELATNAAKYGALSTSAGTLDVTCIRGPAGGALTWRETSPGLQVTGKIGGSGLALIERLARDLGGEAKVTLTPTGLEAIVTFELVAD